MIHTLDIQYNVPWKKAVRWQNDELGKCERLRDAVNHMLTRCIAIASAREHLPASWWTVSGVSIDNSAVKNYRIVDVEVACCNNAVSHRLTVKYVGDRNPFTGWVFDKDEISAFCDDLSTMSSEPDAPEEDEIYVRILEGEGQLCLRIPSEGEYGRPVHCGAVAHIVTTAVERMCKNVGARLVMPSEWCLPEYVSVYCGDDPTICNVDLCHGDEFIYTFSMKYDKHDCGWYIVECLDHAEDALLEYVMKYQRVGKLWE